MPNFLVLALLLSVVVTVSGCVPVPVSTVSLHPRVQRTFIAESPRADNQGAYSLPAFDPTGTIIAVHDSGSGLVRLMRVTDLSPVDNRKPSRWPRRLSFSPRGGFLVIEEHSGWMHDFLAGVPVSKAITVRSPEAIRDDVQKVEVWDLKTGQSVTGLYCDTVTVSEPQGGWLWAKDKAIVPGYRSSPVLAAYFSLDEKIFTLLCRDGTRQRWDSHGWGRMTDLPPPPLWDPMTGFSDALLFGEVAAPVQAGGAYRLALSRLESGKEDESTLYVWDERGGQIKRLPGKCVTGLQPVHALSWNGKSYVAVCIGIMSHVVHGWDVETEHEIPLEEGDFGLTSGAPAIRRTGLALAPDGQYLAAAAMGLATYLVVTPMPNAALVTSRSDLRLWRRQDSETGWHPLPTLAIDELAGRVDHLHGVDLAFSPDGKLLALAGKQLRLYRLADLIIAP